MRLSYSCHSICNLWCIYNCKFLSVTRLGGVTSESVNYNQLEYRTENCRVTLCCWYFSGCIWYSAFCFAFMLSTVCLGLLWLYLYLPFLSVCSTLHPIAFNPPHSHHPWKPSGSFSSNTFISICSSLPYTALLTCSAISKSLFAYNLSTVFFLLCTFDGQQKLHILPEQGSLLSPYCGPWGLENLLPFSAEPQHL